MDKEACQVLQFLFDKRLELFNLRRDHEWRVTFGALTLIGAVDAGLLTKDLKISSGGIWLWWGALFYLFVAVTIYQFGVQTRNRVDRIAMDAIYRKLCDMSQIAQDDMVRVGIDTSNKTIGPISTRIIRWTYLWAFTCQTAVLAACCIMSGVLPHILNGAFQIRNDEECDKEIQAGVYGLQELFLVICK